ncbi:MAG: succinylglutamate desuccinylase/aspartoacylase family protein [Candidatus Bathyarchaeia archaeon]
MSEISFDEYDIGVGEAGYGNIAIPEFFADGQGLEIPFLVMNGADPGPCLYIQVAQHGSEVMGLEAVRRLILELDPLDMSGSLIYCLPNPLAFRERQRATALDPVPGGMNRVWPGDPRGSPTERMADLIWRELVCKADEVVDLHTGSRRAPAWVFYEGEGVSEEASREVEERSAQMARIFGAPILYVETEAYGGRKTLRANCVDNGIPAIVPELSGAGYFDEEIVEMAYRGLRNILVDLGIIEGSLELPERQFKLKWTSDSKEYSVLANSGGVFMPTVELGDIVEEGEEVGYIYSPRTFEELESLSSPQAGYVFHIRENPIVNQGDQLIRVPEILEEFSN